jgi:hypothetical protein
MQTSAKIINVTSEDIGSMKVLHIITDKGNTNSIDNQLLKLYQANKLIGKTITVDIDDETSELDYNCIARAAQLNRRNR